MNIIQKISRSEAITLAWAIRREGMAWGEAISRAWKTLRLKLRLAHTDEKGEWISYTKDNGEVRKALATRATAHIPAEHQPKGNTPANEKPHVIKYFDILQDGWRSFRADRLILNF
jgi:hypothetical protein